MKKQRALFVCFGAIVSYLSTIPVAFSGTENPKWCQCIRINCRVDSNFLAETPAARRAWTQLNALETRVQEFLPSDSANLVTQCVALTSQVQSAQGQLSSREREVRQRLGNQVTAEQMRLLTQDQTHLLSNLRARFARVNEQLIAANASLGLPRHFVVIPREGAATARLPRSGARYVPVCEGNQRSFSLQVSESALATGLRRAFATQPLGQVPRLLAAATAVNSGSLAIRRTLAAAEPVRSRTAVTDITVFDVALGEPMGLLPHASQWSWRTPARGLRRLVQTRGNTPLSYLSQTCFQESLARMQQFDTDQVCQGQTDAIEGQDEGGLPGSGGIASDFDEQNEFPPGLMNRYSGTSGRLSDDEYCRAHSETYFCQWRVTRGMDRVQHRGYCLDRRSNRECRYAFWNDRSTYCLMDGASNEPRCRFTRDASGFCHSNAQYYECAEYLYEENPRQFCTENPQSDMCFFDDSEDSPLPTGYTNLVSDEGEEPSAVSGAGTGGGSSSGLARPATAPAAPSVRVVLRRTARRFAIDSVRLRGSRPRAPVGRDAVAFCLRHIEMCQNDMIWIAPTGRQTLWDALGLPPR